MAPPLLSYWAKKGRFVMRVQTTYTAALATLTLVGLMAGCSSDKKSSRRGQETENPDTGGTAGGIRWAGNQNANVLSSISPDKGSPFGGTAVTLTGTDFVTGATVEFDGTAAASIAVVSSSEITCETPAHAAGVVDVVVTLPNGQTGRLNNGFTYDPNLGPMARVADYGDPTGEEQELLELMQRARRDPVAEGNRLGLDFSQYQVRPPLSYNGFLAEAALKHSEDMASRAFYGHVNPDGDSANGRVLDTQYPLNPFFGTARDVNLTENIGVASGNRFQTPQDVHDTFMIDAGVPGTKHRNMILGVGGHFPKMREVGIGYRTNLPSASQWEHYVTEEFAFSKDDEPFVVGVACNDDGDGVCRAGEGRAGVDVTISHASGFTLTTQTVTAGGYAFEVLVPGDYTITIDGQSTQVTIAQDSVKVDLFNGGIKTY